MGERGWSWIKIRDGQNEKIKRSGKKKVAGNEEHGVGWESG